MTIITIARLEKAINDCRRVHPPVDYVLGPDLRKLATIWGEMIARKQKELDIGAQSFDHQEVLFKWLGAAAGHTDVRVDDSATLQVCPIRQDPDDECEVCQ
ncbi:DUF3717 domain-containing protein [Massilia sp. CCM 8734]|uniref:DUF3717 domain-containing protein n=1 Tax=Massilia sp. CCM 8734 TaxID=2609283 RepID=UPI0014230C06|nr:DUF3717 domain-containing protein [Massilia sp. CCM 8734]NHZ99032.1 DUF3717 domain-containing protein [Massilia sp. CCM 8734]